jgi:hypothetical protein
MTALPDEWLESPLYIGVAVLHDVRHVIEVPVMRGETAIGGDDQFCDERPRSRLLPLKRRHAYHVLAADPGVSGVDPRNAIWPLRRPSKNSHVLRAS